jgi:hypothetical protein
MDMRKILGDGDVVVDPAAEAFFTGDKVECIQLPLLCPQGEHVVVAVLVVALIGLWKGQVNRDWGLLHYLGWPIHMWVFGFRRGQRVDKHHQTSLPCGGGVAAFAMVVTRLAASADGKP